MVVKSVRDQEDEARRRLLLARALVNDSRAYRYGSKEKKIVMREEAHNTKLPWFGVGR